MNKIIIARAKRFIPTTVYRNLYKKMMQDMTAYKLPDYLLDKVDACTPTSIDFDLLWYIMSKVQEMDTAIYVRGHPIELLRAFQQWAENYPHHQTQKKYGFFGVSKLILDLELTEKEPFLPLETVLILLRGLDEDTQQEIFKVCAEYSPGLGVAIDKLLKEHEYV